MESITRGPFTRVTFLTPFVYPDPDENLHARYFSGGFQPAFEGANLVANIQGVPEISLESISEINHH